MKKNYKLLHISTDCVFSGLKGNYTETDLIDTLNYMLTKPIDALEIDTNLFLEISVLIAI